jgi:hypothetical protein
MKKLFILTIALTGFVISSLPSFGQCVPDSAHLSQSQLIYPAELPCIMNDSVYSSVLSIVVPDTVPGRAFNIPQIAGQNVIIDSIRIDSINGAPAGITSSSSPALGSWIKAGGYACALFSGTTTTATIGNYPLTISGIGCGYVNFPLIGPYDTCMPFNFSQIYPYDLQVCDTLCTNIYDTVNATLCRGDSIQWGVFNVKRAGRYVDTVLMSTGCDSLKILFVTTINPATSRDTVPVSCYSVVFNSITYTHDTTINVILPGAAVNGCDSTIRNVIVVGGLVVPTIAASGTTLTATDAAAVSWQWFANGSAISTATSATYTLTGGSTSYTVVATDKYGCTDTSTALVASGINNLAIQNIKLYPNPNNGSFILETHAMGVPYTITNSLGQVIERNTISSMKQEINLANAPTGVYTITIKGVEPIQFSVFGF